MIVAPERSGGSETGKKKVIADASILIHLSAIGRFYLLRELFQGVTIPEGVYAEVVIEGWGLSGSLETAEAIRGGFITLNPVMDKEKVKEISQRYKVSISNAEVIQLATEVNAEIVLADEEEVREAAEVAGFRVRGCLGILIGAVKNEILSSRQAIRDVDNLVKTGYRVNDDIIGTVKDALRRWAK
jgi:predicted nucleic acid-binding protein